MNATARYPQVMLAFWRQGQFLSRWGCIAIAALMVLSCIAGAIWLPTEAAWRLPLGLLLIVVMSTWMAMAMNLQEQNHPTAARTVPGHARTLKRAALAGWMTSTLLFTLLAWAVMPVAKLWPMLLLCSGFFAAFLLWTTRLVWIWLLSLLISPLSVGFGSQLGSARHAIATLWETHTYAVLLLCLLFQGWLVMRAIADGGAKHQARYARQVQMRRAMQMQMEGKAPGINSWAPFERVLLPFVRILSAWLQHVLDRADNASLRSVMARGEIVLHGPQHWLRYALTMGTILAVVVMVFSAVLVSTNVSLAIVLKHGGFGIGIGLASAGLNPAFTTPSALWGSRREQALLRLLPGMPQGRTLNQAMARLQWRDFIVSWLLTTLILVALGTAVGHQLLLCLPLAALPIAALTLTRRPALMQAPTTMTAMVPSFALLTLAGILFLLTRELGVSLWTHALAMFALAALLLAWRWPRMLAAPTAMPAGRLSTG